MLKYFIVSFRQILNRFISCRGW